MEASKTCTHCGSAVAEDRVRRDFQGFCPGCLAREAGAEIEDSARRSLRRSARRPSASLALVAGTAALVAGGAWILGRDAPSPPRTGPAAEHATLPGKEARTLRGHQGQVVSISFNPDGSTLASSGVDGAVHLWDASNGLLKQSLSGRRAGWVSGLAWSPGGDLLASGGRGDRHVRFWDPRTGKPARELALAPDASAECLSFHPRLNLLAVSSGREGEGRIDLWDHDASALRRSFPGHGQPVLRISFSPDGRHLAAGSLDPSVRLWEVESGREIWSLRPGCPSAGESVEFSPDGRWIASEREEAVLALWEASTGNLVRVFEGHERHIHDVAFGPDGSWIATGSGDTTIRVWSTETGRCLRVLEGHRGGVRSLDVSKDGLRLASGSADGTVRIWENPAASHSK